MVKIKNIFSDFLHGIIKSIIYTIFKFLMKTILSIQFLVKALRKLGWLKISSTNMEENYDIYSITRWDNWK